jgi:hypothetical protein
MSSAPSRSRRARSRDADRRRGGPRSAGPPQRRRAPLGILLLGLLAALAPPGAAARSIELQSVPVLPASELSSTAGLPAPPTTHPFLVADPAKLRRQKRRAASRLAGEPWTGGGASAARSGAAPLGSLFDGLNELGLAAAAATPPDSTGAIGPDHYVEMVNSEVGVFRRSGLAQQASQDLDVFAGAPGSFLVDPQIQWDPQAERWLYVAISVVAPGDNFLAVGWSRTSSPTPLGASGWCRFFVASPGDQLDDYPKLGHNDNHIILGTNVFDDSGVLPNDGNFLTSRIWTLSKPANGDTSCAAPTSSFFGSPGSPLRTSDGDLAYTPVPANTSESAANGYVTAADSPLTGGGNDQIMAWHVSGPRGAPAIIRDGNISVDPFSIPADVPQPGTANVLDALDARLTQAVAITDPKPGELAVWTQHTVNGSGGRSVARWYELLPESLKARQQGEISSSSHFVFNAAISPTATGDRAVIDYNVGGSTLLPEIRAETRDPGVSRGKMGDPVTLGTSSAADLDSSCNFPDPGDPCRWGDYAGASPDPEQSVLAWGSNQVNGPSTSDPQWRTRNFALIADNTKPALKLSGSKTQSSKKQVRVKAKCDRRCRVRATGKVVLTKRKGGGASSAAKKRKLRLKAASVTVKVGKKKTLRLKLRKKDRKTLRKTLKRGWKARAKITGKATDAAERSIKQKRTVKIKRK